MARYAHRISQPIIVTCTSHQMEARKKRRPIRDDHQNAAREVAPRNKTSHGTSAIHAHHGWLKFGKARIRRPALTSANGDEDVAILRNVGKSI